MSSANVDCVKRFILGSADVPDDIHSRHDDVEAVAAHKDPGRGRLVSELLAPDVVFHIPASLPYGGDHVGPEGFRAMSAAMNATWRISGGLDMSFADFGEDQVVTFHSWLGESLHTGRTVPVRMATFFRVAAGKIVEVTIFYWDTAEIVEATGGIKTITPDHVSVPVLRR